MALLIDQLASWLQAQGQGTVGTDLFKLHRPTSPAALVSLHQQGGGGPDAYTGLRYPRILIAARAESQQAALTKAESLFSLLKEQIHLDLGDGFYAHRLHALSEPTGLGEEQLTNKIGYLAGFNIEIILRD